MVDQYLLLFVQRIVTWCLCGLSPWKNVRECLTKDTAWSRCGGARTRQKLDDLFVRLDGVEKGEGSWPFWTCWPCWPCRKSENTPECSLRPAGARTYDRGCCCLDQRTRKCAREETWDQPRCEERDRQSTLVCFQAVSLSNWYGSRQGSDDILDIASVTDNTFNLHSISFIRS